MVGLNSDGNSFITQDKNATRHQAAAANSMLAPTKANLRRGRTTNYPFYIVDTSGQLLDR